MGTNYYWVEKKCKSCGHYEHREHIGKSSYGWTFSFHETFDCKSWKDWQLLLNSGKGDIFDEYGDFVSFSDFKRIVENRSHPNGELKNHARCYPDRSFCDPEGHSFSSGDFS